MRALDAPTVVCFDLGGVLVRICRSWAEACEQAGLPLRNADWLASGEWRERRKRVVDGYQDGSLSCGAYHRALSESVDGLYSPDEVETIHRAWTLAEYPGVDRLVTELNALDGVHTACLSNTNHAHWQRLDGGDGRGEYPAVQRLTTRLASHRLGLLKPGAAIYEAADQAWGRSADGTPPEAVPSRVIFFDDLEDNVTAAREHGWHAHLVDYRGDTAAQMRELLSHEHHFAL
jgi:FMN phosphatase YigB (HAD superfamily)